jgi:small subunit ribosomal protein S20
MLLHISIKRLRTKPSAGPRTIEHVLSINISAQATIPAEKDWIKTIDMTKIIRQNSPPYKMLVLSQERTLANSAQARKRARQADKRRSRNQAQRSEMRTHIKRVVKQIAAGSKEEAVAAYNQAVPAIDSAVSKGLIHKNKAARHKSRLNVQIKAM